ncbi:MAG: hypothetical protein NZT61_05560 [Deltaproteobacteria bacterium]|nr:hypothetical protein [Deltaproteobacteria bacterium]
MELFRFFIPFLDPSSLSSPLTKVELEELSSVFSIIKRVFDMQVERNKPLENRTVNHEKLESLAKALEYCQKLLWDIIKTHRGDTREELESLLKRIKKVPKSEELLAEIDARIKSTVIKNSTPNAA